MLKKNFKQFSALILTFFFVFSFWSLVFIPSVKSADGILPTGPSQIKPGYFFNIEILASAQEFNALEGKITVSGPLNVVTLEPNRTDMYWVVEPIEGTTFSGAFLGMKKESYKIADLQIKALEEGIGKICVEDVGLLDAGEIVSESGDCLVIDIKKENYDDSDEELVDENNDQNDNSPDSGSEDSTSPVDLIHELDLQLPDKIDISSSSHPDQSIYYSDNDAIFKWSKEEGIEGFSFLLDQSEATVPVSQITVDDTKFEMKDLSVGTHYFHIKAKNKDGWGDPSHYKVNIKKKLKCSPSQLDIQILKIEKAGKEVRGITVLGNVSKGDGISIGINPSPDGIEDLSAADVNEEGAFTYNIEKEFDDGEYDLFVQVEDQYGEKCGKQKDVSFKVKNDAKEVEILKEEESSVSFSWKLYVGLFILLSVLWIGVKFIKKWGKGTRKH